MWYRRSLLQRRIVSLNADGTILSIEQAGDLDRQSGVEFYNGILIPGMVNAHCHLELSYLRGEIAEGGGFAAFAQAMGRVRGRHAMETRLRAIVTQDAKMWREGVSAVGDICNGATTFDAKASSRIQYINYLELFGMQATGTEALQELEREAAARGLEAYITPHATYSLSERGFSAAVSANPTGPRSIHFMESPAEEQLFRQSGSLWEWYGTTGMAPDFLHHGSPAGRIAACVPQGSRLLLVHNCCVEKETIETIHSRFGTENVYWVLCPGSNHYISRLRPPVELLRQAGATICLGTDSLASNRELSLVDEMARFPDVPLAERIAWATENGAAALGQSDRYGELRPGMRPGIVLLGGIDFRTMNLTENAFTRRLA